MSLTTYQRGIEVIGEMAAGPALVVRLADPVGTAARSSALAGLVGRFAPATVTTAVYDEMAKRLKSDFQSSGVAADIRVVETAPPGQEKSAFLKDGVRDLVIGILGGIGAGLGLALLFRRKGG